MGVTIKTDDTVRGNTTRTADARRAPYINTVTGTWWEYDKDTMQFKDTGVSPYGIQGEQGPPGDIGLTGPKGEPGQSVSVLYVEPSTEDNGYSVIHFTDGTSVSIKNGSRGTPGIAGKDGKDGLPGMPGPAGKDGSVGPKGDPGIGVSILSVIPSQVDGGENVILFTDGTVISIRNGNTGSQGPRGYQGVPGVPGQTGETGNGIASIVLNDDYSLTINYTDGNSYTTDPIRGEKGEKGDPGEVQWDVVATEWQAWTQYYGGHLYVYNDELYLCKLDEDESGESAYFPTSDFAQVTINSLYRSLIPKSHIATVAQTKAYLGIE